MATRTRATIVALAALALSGIGDAENRGSAARQLRAVGAPEIRGIRDPTANCSSRSERDDSSRQPPCNCDPKADTRAASPPAVSGLRGHRAVEESTDIEEAVPSRSPRTEVMSQSVGTSMCETKVQSVVETRA